MKKQFKTLVVCLLLSTAFVLGAEENMIFKLNLSRAQVKQIQAQEKLRSREMIRLREQLQVKERELKAELAKTEPNKAQLQNITREINQLRAKQLNEQVDSILAAKKVMNKEQLKELEKLQEQSMLGQTNQYQYRKGAASGGTGSGDGSKRGK